MKIENIENDIIICSVRPEPLFGDELAAITEIVHNDIDINVIVDFSSVNIIRSSSLTKLLKLRQALVSRNHQIVLCNIHALTKSIMEITDLSRVFSIVIDKQAAISMLHSSRFAPML